MGKKLFQIGKFQKIYRKQCKEMWGEKKINKKF